MKEKITKSRGFSFAASLIMLLCLFSFNAKAQQQAFAVPKDTLYVIKSAVPGGHDHVTRHFIVPAGVDTITIQCWGGGAAGGYAKDYPYHCAGGGGGAYARVVEIKVTPGEKLTVEIGAGGVGKKSGIHKGGDTRVLRGSTVLVMAGGAPAVADNQLTGGAGATNYYGDYGTSGGNGGNGKMGYAGLGCSGGGGGAAGSAGNGGNAVNADDGGGGGVPGISNSAFSGSYIPGKGGSSDVVAFGAGAHGGAGSNYGAGGAGAICSFWNEGYYVGGDGANGAVLITYDDCSAEAGAIALSKSGCYKQLVNSVSASGAPGTYFWEKSKTGEEGTWSVIPGATNDNYTPSDSAYYRRGYTTRCGNSVRTLAQYVAVGFPAPGFVALTTSPATTSLTVCKWSTANFSLSMYSSSTPQVKWQKSVNQGATWSDMGTYQPVGDAKVIDETNVQVETWYRAVYEPSTDCEVPTSNQFVLKVEDGVIGRPDFWFDTTTVHITLRYGDKDTNVYIFRAEYEPKGSIILTNNRGGVINEGRLLGTQGPGTYTIDWTLTDCGDPVTYTKKYVISYPDCNELLSARDFDANRYNTVRINANCWTKENMRSQHYNLGDTVYGNYVYESAQYPDTAANLATFGRLYTWYAAVGIPEGSDDVPATNIFGHIVGACPQGWFLPDATLMADLNTFLSKDLRTYNLWVEENGTNLTGMSAKPAGCRNGENSRFEDLHISSYFWTSQEVISEKSYAFWLDCHCSTMQLKEYNKHDAMSIRCVKENEETLPTVIEFQPAQLSYSEARLFGDVIDCGGLPILERGFCYSTTPMPELNDGSSFFVQNSVPAVGPYNNDINGLSTGVVYYVRAYAKNALGTAYSDQKIFSLTDMPDTIYFYANGGSSSMDPQLVARGVLTPLNKCLFSYPLSTFKGWSTTPTGAVEYADQANILTSGNVDLYAQWYVPTHTAITRVACGSYTWTEGDGQTYTTSGDYVYPHVVEHGCTQVDTLHLTINPVYSFTEDVTTTSVPYIWHSQSYTETGTYYDSLLTACCNCDSVYILNLTVNTPIMDTVFFDANGGENTMTPQVFTRNIAQQLKANTFTYPLSVFKCWNTQPSGSGSDFTNQQSITTTGSMTLYAQWYHPQHQSTIVTACGSYTWIGGTGATYTTSGTSTYSHTDVHGCTQVDTLHLTINPTYTESETHSISASYTPYEWHGKNLMTSGVYRDTLPTVKGCDSIIVLTLTVIDSIQKSITFYKNDGTSTKTTQKVNINMPTALNPNNFTNSYLRFDGWNTQPYGSGTSYTDRQLVTLTDNLTLYAQWGSWCDGTPAANEAGNGRVDSVKDHQSNWYEVVQIGTQCWLKENMRATTSPSTGTTILKNHMVQNNVSKAACYYDNNSSNRNTYGVMYNWCAMMDVHKNGKPEVASETKTNGWDNPGITLPRQGICPTGWHVPTVDEWNTMTTYAGITVSTSSEPSSPNGVGKLAGSGWDYYYYSSGSENGYPGNLNYTYHNSTGFTALPGGFYCDYSSGFDREDECTHFWVARSNSAEVRCITYNYKHLYIEKEDAGWGGTSVERYDASYVRCVRN